jgi:hypothetical protein
VDHHGLIVLIVALALGCACRMIQHPERRRWPVLAGLAMAVGLTIALEILPCLLVLSIFLGLWAVIKGGTASRAGLLYALTLFVGSLLCLLLTRPPADLLKLDVLTYSAVYVILMGGIAVAFAGVYVTMKAPVAVRFAVAALLAAVSGAPLWRNRPGAFPDHPERNRRGPTP